MLTPLFGLLLAAVILAGRVQEGRADVESAARGAARKISMARDPNAGTARAEADVRRVLNVGGPYCQTMRFAPTVQADRVTVAITCQVDLREVSVLPVPGTFAVTGTASEVIDTFRER
jgi:hypothetical protein